MRKWQFSILSRIGSIVLVCAIGWLSWQHLGPRKPEIGPVRKELADKVIPSIVEDIRTSRDSMRSVTLCHFANDPTDYFTNHLRTVIEHRGTLDLRDRTLKEKVRNLLNLRHSSYGTIERSLKQGRKLRTDGVLSGTIHAFESYPGGGTLDVEVTLANVATGQTVFSKRYDKEMSSSSMLIASIQGRAGTFPWFQRLLGWLLAVLLLPVFTISFMRAMVRKESNKTNAFVLGIYTVADSLLAWLLVGAALNSLWTVLVFIVAVGLAFAYNVRIMTFALRLEEA